MPSHPGKAPPTKKPYEFRGKEHTLNYAYPLNQDERPRPKETKPSSGKKPTPAELGYMTEEVLLRWGRDRLPRDLEITDPWIMVIDNAPPRKMYTSALLKAMTPGKSVRMIEPFKPGDPESDDPRPTLALCKVVDQTEEYRKLKNLKTSNKKVKGPSPKHLNIAWGIEDHDLKPKIKKLVAFLTKGARVDVQMYNKKNGRQRTIEEAQALVDGLRTIVVEEGFKERMCDGVLLGPMVLTFGVKEGKTKTVKPEISIRDIEQPDGEDIEALDLTGQISG
ncbi:hypothetical protein XA68_11791 [Ophiocordyceps unilateralis]|uniref:Translation initiation factor 3 N-terminal domain-containing protein n=1 Tax=Ophiocordyceps unilateralis TaxID=268505 RepID=A0A2A9PG01_OPHUN|nr:hypothetical protein XA68_11791 [Ophiocordyceps unilateralis]